ncbi:MAG: phosphoribosylanthranilate isomerase [Halanaerobiaceae bacterium]
MVQVKICGLTQKRDVQRAVSLGADVLGFILAPSPRQVSLEQVARIQQEIPPFVFRTAVVVNPERERLEDILATNLFNCIQFHGTEKPGLLAEVKTPGLKIIKALSVGQKNDLQAIKKYQSFVDHFLFDTRVKGQTGGTGQTFDWNLLAEIQVKKPFILAGGLGPDNLLKALEEVQPAVVDINSRCEKKPGIKDFKLLENVFAIIDKYNKNRGVGK